MTREEAREALRAVHPCCLQLALIWECRTGEEHVTSNALYYRSAPLAAWRNLDYWPFQLLSHAYNVEPEYVVRVPAPQDLAELLASEVQAVRLLALRLAGRAR